jgi:hypothetical protein
VLNEEPTIDAAAVWKEFAERKPVTIYEAECKPTYNALIEGAPSLPVMKDFGRYTESEHYSTARPRATRPRWEHLPSTRHELTGSACKTLRDIQVEITAIREYELGASGANPCDRRVLSHW